MKGHLDALDQQNGQSQHGMLVQALGALAAAWAAVLCQLPLCPLRSKSVALQHPDLAVP